MATTAPANPVPKLVDDYCTIVPNKGEGLRAYEKSIPVAEKKGAEPCIKKLRKLHEQETRKVEEIKKRLRVVLDHFKA